VSPAVADLVLVRDIAPMWQLLFRVLVVRFLGLLWIIVLFPAVLVILTPIIILRAVFVAWRHGQRFRFALADAYTEMWDGFCQIVGFLFANRM
jgi:hypothetical protein